MPIAAILFALTLNSVNHTTISSSDEIITIEATASGLQSGVTQYLQGAITKEGEATNYLGLTKNLNEEWYQYKSSPTTGDLSTYFYNFTPIAGTWSGQISVKIDPNDDGYKGPGTYLVKLIKYISSSGSVSNNYLPITINIPLIATVAAQNNNEAQSNPELNVLASNSARLGEDIKISIQLKDFEPQKEFYVKARFGMNPEQLSRGQTKNAGVYLTDNESWINFPIIKTTSDGSYTGEIYGLISEEKDEGLYKYKIRIRKKETETFFDSPTRDITLIKVIPVPPAVITILKDVKQTATPSIDINEEKQSTVESLVTAEVLGSKSADSSDIVNNAVKKSSPRKSAPLFVLGIGVLVSAALMAIFMYRAYIWSIISKVMMKGNK
ncbi:hypothetical protein HY310_03455 [Candidatus Microgenomates bacterium]|nr:hypothetical protein [Candidatus Microgenomates bacterium]